MNKDKIAIYSSNGFAETFTKAHRDLLPVSFIITEGTPPRMANGQPMLPMDKWSVIKRKVKSLFGIGIKPEEPLDYFLAHQGVNLLIAEFGMAGAAVVAVCKKHNVKLMVNFYGIDAFGYKIIEENKVRYQEMFRYASVFSVQSCSIKNKLVSLGCPEDKIVVNSCPPSEIFFSLQPALDSPVLIAVGRFVEKKAPLLTIKSFHEVLNSVPDARLILVGDGPLMNDALHLADELKIKNKIEFTGSVNPDQQIKYMMNASVFVQHSVTAKDGDCEGLPVAIMEASAMGMPVVSTFHSGIPEAVENDKTGFLVKEGDYHTMAAYCIQLLKSPELRKQMGEMGRKKMRAEFTMKNHIDKIKETITSILCD